MNELALFAGMGGGIIAGRMLGFRTICAVELDGACRERLLRRQLDGVLPLFPIWDDARTFDGTPFAGMVDIVTAGVPCQKNSIAGGTRDPGEEELWLHTFRIIEEVRPEWVALENPPGAIVSTGFLGFILAELAKRGFDARWDRLSAAGSGACHIRWRRWIFAHTNGGAPRGEPGRRERKGRRVSLQPGSPSDSWALTGSSSRLAQPRVGRAGNGMADRVDRLRALGNGIVPQCMAQAWELLTD